MTRANNCEHFVNRAVLGLNFSELADRRVKGWSGTEFSSGGAFDNSIRKQLNNNKILDSLTDFMPYGKINDVNKCKEEALRKSGGSFNAVRDGIKMEAVIIVKPSSWYRLN